MRHYKNAEAKAEFIRRNAADLANRLTEISTFQISPDCENWEKTVLSVNMEEELRAIQKAVGKLAEAVDVDVDKPLDGKDFSIVNTLIMYDLTEKREE